MDSKGWDWVSNPHSVMKHTGGLILSSFPALTQLQCSPELRECYLEEPSVTVSPLKDVHSICTDSRSKENKDGYV